MTMKGSSELFYDKSEELLRLSLQLGTPVQSPHPNLDPSL